MVIAEMKIQVLTTNFHFCNYPEVKKYSFSLLFTFLGIYKDQTTTEIDGVLAQVVFLSNGTKNDNDNIEIAAFF